MLTGAAVAELEAVLDGLPPDIADAARDVPITFEDVPNEDLVADGLAVDTLGLFVGPSHAEGEWVGADLPPQIIVFLQNIWEFVGRDPRTYRMEVRRTLLHELGHFLGMDEDDLYLRDLD